MAEVTKKVVCFLKRLTERDSKFLPRLTDVPKLEAVVNQLVHTNDNQQMLEQLKMMGRCLYNFGKNTPDDKESPESLKTLLEAATELHQAVAEFSHEAELSRKDASRIQGPTQRACWVLTSRIRRYSVPPIKSYTLQSNRK